MSLLLARAGLLSQGLGDAPGPEPGDVVEMDTLRVPAGYTLSNANLTVVNTSGGSDYRRWVPAGKLLPADFAGIVYWEVRVQATQSGSLNGYIGVHPAPLIDDATYGHDAGNNPGQAEGGIGYRGNGTIWADGSSQTSGPESYGDGDVLMFAFAPGSGSLWVGRNGAWHRDPDTDGASYTTPNPNGTGWLPLIQGRDDGDGGTLRSSKAQFDHAVPAVATPYGAELTNEVAQLSAYTLDAWSELGGGDALTVGRVTVWLDAGGGRSLSAGTVDVWLDAGGGASLSAVKLEIWIEEDVS